MRQPPVWPSKILKLFCNPELYDEIVGDMEEMYVSWTRMYGERKARRLYIINTLKFLRPFIFKRLKRQPMTLNYFKVAWRSIKHNRGFATINVIGLTLGITSAIIIYTLVSHHLGFDNFHPDANNTYRVVLEFRGEQLSYTQWTPQPFGKAFKNDFAFGDKVVRLRAYRNVVVSLPDEPGNKKFEESESVAFTDADFFNVFNFPAIAGVTSALKEPNTAVITSSTAQKYFGTNDAINKLIRVNSRGTMIDYHIVGILANTPDNTHFNNQIYLSYENLKDYDAWFAGDDSWGSIASGMECFVTLKPNITREQVEEGLIGLVKKYYDETEEGKSVYKLQPLSEIHFDPLYGGTFSNRNLWTLSIVGVVLVLIACINFVNLATAQVLNRSREVGVRKILGSQRAYIFMQFITETGIIAMISLIAAGLVSYAALPIVNSVLGERLSIHLFDQWQLPVFVSGTLVFIVLASGAYPALMMTRFQPVRVLKGKMSAGGEKLSMRRILIVAQFVVSQVLIISMIVIHSQMEYSETADLGFSKDAIVMLPVPAGDPLKMKTLDQRISQVPGVVSSSLCYQAPSSSNNSWTGVHFAERPQDEVWAINLREGDENFISTFGLKLVAGRNLMRADTTREFLVNETAVKKLGFASPDEILGKRLSVNGKTMNGTIEGVVKDFHTESLHSEIAPVCIAINYGRFRNIAVKIDMNNTQSAITEFNRIWSETYPDNVFSYEFLDDRIARFYEADKAVLRLVEAVSVIAIIISCLGLYGLVSFMAIRKTKEIGVRKVLGASVSSILWLFGREFVLLIVIAFAGAAPLAWMVMNKWLEAFTYRVEVSPLSFVLAVACTIVIAVITVSYHSLRSALANPANSLRTE